MIANFTDKMRWRRPYSELYSGKIKGSIDGLLEALGLSIVNGRTLEIIDNYKNDEGVLYGVAFKIGLDDGEVTVARSHIGEEKEFSINGTQGDLSFNAVLRFVYVGNLSEILDDGTKGDEVTIKLAYYNIMLRKSNLGYKIKQKASKNEPAELTTYAYDNNEGRLVRNERYHVVMYNFKEVLDEVSDFVEDPIRKCNGLRSASAQNSQMIKNMRNTQSGKNGF